MREFLNAPTVPAQQNLSINGSQNSDSPKSPLGGKTVRR